MRIVELEIENFRCFREAKIPMSDLTLFLGRNGSGKSTLLHALRYFFRTDSVATLDDYYARTDCTIRIAVTFGRLSPEETAEFAGYVHDGLLRVVKSFSTDSPAGLYHGRAPQIEPFATIRPLKGREFNSAYRELRGGEFPELPTAASESANREALAAYEAAHPEQCVLLPRPVQFLGPKNIGGGKLDKFTLFVMVPAVRDAGDDADARGGVIPDLINMVVRRQIESREDVRAFRTRYETEAKQVYSNENLGELGDLATAINGTLKDYNPGATLSLQWADPKVPELRLPDVVKRLVEDGFDASIQKVGHGLQRALVITLLQHLESAKYESARAEEVEANEGEGDVLPVLAPSATILAIEEPELYLHPSRCRYLANLLRSLSEGNDSGFQIICATHSPYFVDLSEFGNVRLVAKHSPPPDADHAVKAAKCERCDLEAAAGALAVAWGREGDPAFTGASFQARLRRVVRPNPAINEAFFADLALLVEGQTEWGLLPEVARQVGAEWERLGVVVVPCSGKANLDRPLIVLRELGVRTFVLFDGDKVKQGGEGQNLALQRLSGVEDPASWPETGVHDQHAVFEDDIESYLREAVGEPFERTRDEAARELGHEGGTGALKRSDVATLFARRVYEDLGTRLPAIEQIVERATALVSPPTTDGP